MPRISREQLRKALATVDYPMAKDDLVCHAEQSNAGEPVQGVTQLAARRLRQLRRGAALGQGRHRLWQHGDATLRPATAVLRNLVSPRTAGNRLGVDGHPEKLLCARRELNPHAREGTRT